VHAGTIVDDHVAGVYDFGETDDGLVYLAMEYVPGDTITRMVKKEGPFQPARVAELTRQIAKGLDAAHAQGIIHRDLKPDNIMIMRDRHGRELVKIVDFGIAKALGTDSRGVTEMGAIVGTLLFMSPEQLAGGTLDRRSDLYSLALVVFHMLAGALPFTGSTPEEVIYARFDSAGPRPLAVVRPTVIWPPGVQAVIDRALARDAAMRFDTAGEFAAALSAAVTRVGAASDVKAPRRVAPKRLTASGQRPQDWFRKHARTISRAAAVSVLSVLVISAGASVVNRWPRTAGATRVDTLARRTAKGEAPVRRKLAESTKVTPRPQTRPNDTNRTVTRTESSTRSIPVDADARRSAALRELERLRNRLHPDSTVSPADARAAIKQLDALMPRLTERTDSLFAMLYQSHAYYHLGELDNQCAVLRKIRARATGTRLEGVVEGYFGYGKCT
jgi:serine/threonine-protein kinase